MCMTDSNFESYFVLLMVPSRCFPGASNSKIQENFDKRDKKKHR
jgi:hypothetical protein